VDASKRRRLALVDGRRGWVWVAETTNTAFEYVCDVVSPEFHVSLEKAKDIAAGAVLICAGGAVALGLLTFWPYFAS
jgi:diacylglycerol kinase (ATP)